MGITYHIHEAAKQPSVALNSAEVMDFILKHRSNTHIYLQESSGLKGRITGQPGFKVQPRSKDYKVSKEERVIRSPQSLFHHFYIKDYREGSFRCKGCEGEEDTGSLQLYT